MHFTKIEIKDKKLFEPFLYKYSDNSCELSFANLFIWSEVYNIQACIEDDILFIKAGSEHDYFKLPMGENLERGMQSLEQYIKKTKKPSSLSALTENMKNSLNSATKKSYIYDEERDRADYIYLKSELTELSGKKFHQKKNHLNKFEKTYAGRYSFEKIEPRHIDEIKVFQQKWCIDNNCIETSSLKHESCAVSLALENFEALGLFGALIKVDGELKAYTVASRLNDDTIDVHIEKADRQIEGIYVAINNKFLKSIDDEKIIYINREEDMGVEGLRKAKLSYNPYKINLRYNVKL